MPQFFTILQLSLGTLRQFLGRCKRFNFFFIKMEASSNANRVTVSKLFLKLLTLASETVANSLRESSSRRAIPFLSFTSFVKRRLSVLLLVKCSIFAKSSNKSNATTRTSSFSVETSDGVSTGIVATSFADSPPQLQLYSFCALILHEVRIRKIQYMTPKHTKRHTTRNR